MDALEIIKELRDVCAAAMKVCEKNGCLLEFLNEAHRCGVKDGFGVRADKYIKEMENG